MLLCVTVHGSEYSFGAHDHPSSGVFEVEPKQCPGFIYRCSVFIGRTSLNPLEFREFIQRMASEYHGGTYHLISKNCNHFTDDLCIRLSGKSIPSWVNRLARLGNNHLLIYIVVCLGNTNDCVAVLYISFSLLYIVVYHQNCLHKITQIYHLVPGVLNTNTNLSLVTNLGKIGNFMSSSGYYAMGGVSSSIHYHARNRSYKDIEIRGGIMSAQA
jgi:hypothetical protein